MKFEWETIGYGDYCLGITRRAKVFGGWIVNNITEVENISDGEEYNLSESMVFIPDPNHEWIVNE